MVRELTHQRLTVVLVGVVLTVAVAVAHPGFADTACYWQKAGLLKKKCEQTFLELYLNYGLLTRVPTAKLDSWVAHVCDALTVLLVAQVHAVGVPVAAPSQRDAQAVHPTLKLICMTTSRGTRGCGEEYVIKL